jgi:hypothetical protein
MLAPVGIFRFQHSWRVPASPDAAYEALADVDHYPLWWPQVRGVERVDDDSGHAFVRSMLPYTLDLLLTREVEDPARRVLRVGITGDLEGWSEWRVVGARAGARADYTQEATVSAGGLERLVPLAAPLLRANHSWMMRAGERGLADYLRG